MQIKKGIYRHFKGNNYRVYGTSLNAVTNEIEVVYRSLYGESKTYSREINNFLEDIDREGYDQKVRFLCINNKAYLLTHDSIHGNVYTGELTEHMGNMLGGLNDDEESKGFKYYLRQPVEDGDGLTTYLCKPGATLIQIVLEKDGTFRSLEILKDRYDFLPAVNAENEKYVEEELISILNSQVLVFENGSLF